MVDILVDGQLAINHVVEEGFRTQAELANVRVLSEHLVSNTGPVELIRERTRQGSILFHQFLFPSTIILP